MTRWCPQCRKGWPDQWSVCGDCVAGLVDGLDASVRCRHCDKEWPARMQSCPNCLAELHPDPVAAAAAIGDLLAKGLRLARPAGTAPFAQGADGCTLLRVAPRSTCRDIDGTRLYRLTRYQAHGDALVVVASDGAPLATFLRTGSLVAPGIDVRNETSAPVGRLQRVSAGWLLIETGGEELAHVGVTDVTLGECVDDQWSLQTGGRRLPLKPLAAVALLLAAKVMLGRSKPDPVRPPPLDDPESVT